MSYTCKVLVILSATNEVMVFADWYFLCLARRYRCRPDCRSYLQAGCSWVPLTFILLDLQWCVANNSYLLQPSMHTASALQPDAC